MDIPLLFTLRVWMLVLNGYSLLISVVKALFTNIAESDFIAVDVNINTGYNSIKSHKYTVLVEVSRLLINSYTSQGQANHGHLLQSNCHQFKEYDDHCYEPFD